MFESQSEIPAVFFGISSWVGVNSSYLQMPLIIPNAPECWTLPTFMTVVVQSSNIMSFAYVFYLKFSPKKLNDGYLIYMTMTLGCVTALLMAFFYQSTVQINGTEHSVGYLVCVFLFATVGTVSSVLFLPFMGRFRECYLVSYMCGQGMNGLFSTFTALIQGVGGEPECIRNNSTEGPAFIKYVPPPRFDTQIFFLTIFLFLVVCTVAFILLNNLDVCKKEFAPGSVIDGNEYHYNVEDRYDMATGEVPRNVLQLSTFNYVKLLSAIFLIGFFGNGIFPGVSTFAILPYGYKAYHLATTLNNVGNSIGSITTQFVKHTSLRILDTMIVLVIIIGIYLFYLATQSPPPPLLETTIGPILVVSSSIAFIGIQSYMKTSIAAIFRYQEGRSLVFQATVSLSCSIIGSIVSFFVVEYTQFFQKPITPC